MQTGEIIQLFAEHGYLCDEAALHYIKAHDHKELLELFDNLNPETLVIDLPGIRNIHRIKRSNTIIKYVDCFKPRPAKIRTNDIFKNLCLDRSGGIK